MFIVLEGLDGSGKTTQLEKIMNCIDLNFPDKKVIFTREPGGYENIVGEQIRQVILNNEMDDYTRALLYAASRYEHQLQIRKWIEEGYIVISDRYIYSSLAYQSNKNLSMEEIMQINRYNDIIKPDYILFYRISMDTYIERKEGRKVVRKLDAIESKSDAFFLKVISNYSDALDKDFSKTIEIDANESLEEVTSSTLNIIKKILKEETK